MRLRTEPTAAAATKQPAAYTDAARQTMQAVTGVELLRRYRNKALVWWDENGEPAADQTTPTGYVRFDCTPKGGFFGLPENGRHVSFTDNVFYQFNSGKIEIFWSVIDQAAIKARL